VGGLGYQIQIFQKRGLREHIYLILLVIPLVALIIDQSLAWIQRQLFPHAYGGDGFLHWVIKQTLKPWEDVKTRFFHQQIQP
jgi:hypothetical protein